MTASKVVTHLHKDHLSGQLFESISETANTAYYIFLATHVPLANSEEVIEDSNERIYKDAYRNMIQGKRMGQADASRMIRNVPYAQKAFDMYDDQDKDLGTKDFYCIVDETSYFHVYKCLDNNRGANSTSQPDFSHITGSNTQIYQTSDGYRWKYMYSVSSAVDSKFSTSEYFPVVSNTTVESSAADGVLDIIKVDGTGEGYDNYVTGTFGAGDLRVNGNTLIYGLVNDSVSSTNGYYTGCLVYISSGTGVGSYATVNDYFVTVDGHFVVINEPFETNPEIASTFQVYPEVKVIGSGSESVNVVARALVNSTGSNSIYRVEVLNRGAEYDYFVANAVANDVVGVLSVAELRPIYAPFGGHGANSSAELESTRLAFSMEFSNSESNTIITTNDFYRVGVMKDPLFANVVLDFSEANGSFLIGETWRKITPKRLQTAATTTTTSANVDCATGDFANQVAAGDYVYLQSGDTFLHQYVSVASVTNSTQMILSSNALFACTTTIVYMANASATGVVTEIDSSVLISTSNVEGTIDAGDILIGTSTGARGIVNTVSRNGDVKDFATFVQCYKYDCALNSGTFTENETVFQTSIDTANAALHSAIVDGANVTIYTSNQIGSFANGSTIIGSISGAIATIQEKFSPELVFGSGDVMYLEEINTPVTRQEDQSEIIKIIYEF